MNNRSFVFVKFPKTGLGNMLLLWAKGIVFSKKNHLELRTSGWFGLRWGALLRREQKKRFYWRYFKEPTLLSRIVTTVQIKIGIVIEEPEVEKLDDSFIAKGHVFLFNKIVPDANLFISLMEYQALIKAELFNLLHPAQKIILSKSESPVIGIHIRRGDFKLGSTITPLLFFINGINIIRKEMGEDLPVTLFTDAEKSEIEGLLALSNIKIAEKKADVLDIILLSRSKIMMLSATSTFGYWSAFLSEAFVIRPMNDWLNEIKPEGRQNNSYFEMKWQFDNKPSTILLQENIRTWQKQLIDEL